MRFKKESNNSKVSASQFLFSKYYGINGRYNLRAEYLPIGLVIINEKLLVSRSIEYHFLHKILYLLHTLGYKVNLDLIGEIQ